jgi:hypothetical protein
MIFLGISSICKFPVNDCRMMAQGRDGISSICKFLVDDNSTNFFGAKVRFNSVTFTHDPPVASDF